MRSIICLRGCRSRRGQKYTRNTAVSTPSGTPMTRAPAVTQKLPTIMGKIPNISLSGFQRNPNRKSGRPILNSAGAPPANMKIQMRATAAMDAHAVSMNTACITDSETFFMRFSLSSGDRTEHIVHGYMSAGI